MSRARSRPAAARPAPLASAARSTRLAVSRTPARSSSSPAAPLNGTAAAARPSPARGPPDPPFSPPGPGGAIPAGRARHRRAGLADRLVHLRDLPDQAPEPLVLRDLPPGLLQLRPRLQVHRPRPPFHLPRQVPLRPVTAMIRGGARAAWLAALTAHLVQRPPPAVPGLAQLPVQLLAPPLEF